MGIRDRIQAAKDSKAHAQAAVDHQRLVDAAATEARELHTALEAARLTDGDGDVPGVILKSGEVAYLIVDGAAFVEPRRAPGQWQGRSSGTSIRIAKGVSYRVGASKGTYTQGEERPTPTDRGTFIVTNQRCVFLGSKRTTEWAYSKLIGYDTAGPGTAFFNVTNRQRTTGVMFGTDVETMVDATIGAAIARFTSQETHDQLVEALDAEYRFAYNTWQALSEGREPPVRPGSQLPPPTPPG